MWHFQQNHSLLLEATLVLGSDSVTDIDRKKKKDLFLRVTIIMNFYQFPYSMKQRVPPVTEDIIPVSEQRNGRSLLPKEEQPGHTRLTGRPALARETRMSSATMTELPPRKPQALSHVTVERFNSDGMGLAIPAYFRRRREDAW